MKQEIENYIDYLIYERKLSDNTLDSYRQKTPTEKAVALKEKLAKETIDISLPGVSHNIGGRNPWHIIIDEISEIFLGPETVQTSVSG